MNKNFKKIEDLMKAIKMGRLGFLAFGALALNSGVCWAKVRTSSHLGVAQTQVSVADAPQCDHKGSPFMMNAHSNAKADLATQPNLPGGAPRPTAPPIRSVPGAEGQAL